MKVIYLDNAASTFPKPPEVAKAMARAVNIFGANPGRSGHFLSMYAANEVYSCREIVGSFFNAPPERVIFTSGATMAINMALKGSLLAGSHVLISDVEHNAVLRPLKALEEIGITFTQAVVDLEDDEKTVRAFEANIKPSTAMIACTHSSNVTGKTLPIKELGALAKKRGLLFLVDAAQTAGSHKIDVKENHIDYLCLAGHKGLYGPQGVGVLIINNDKPLSTMIEGGTGVNSKELTQPMEPPERYESGTVNTPGIVGLREGIKFIERVGVHNVFQFENRLMLYAYDELSKIEEVLLYTKRPEKGFSSVLSFNILGEYANDVADFLDSNGIMVRSGFHCAATAHNKIGTADGGTVRLSFGIFNSKSDIEEFIYVIKKYKKSK